MRASDLGPSENQATVPRAVAYERVDCILQKLEMKIFMIQKDFVAFQMIRNALKMGQYINSCGGMVAWC